LCGRTLQEGAICTSAVPTPRKPPGNGWRKRMRGEVLMLEGIDAAGFYLAEPSC